MTKKRSPYDGTPAEYGLEKEKELYSVEEIANLKIKNFTLKGEVYRAHNCLGKADPDRWDKVCMCETCKEYRDVVSKAGMRVREIEK